MKTLNIDELKKVIDAVDNGIVNDLALSKAVTATAFLGFVLTYVNDASYPCSNAVDDAIMACFAALAVKAQNDNRIGLNPTLFKPKFLKSFKEDEESFTERVMTYYLEKVSLDYEAIKEIYISAYDMFVNAEKDE